MCSCSSCALQGLTRVSVLIILGIWLTLQESFKAAAAAATAELAETVEVADMAADDVLAAVQRALKPLGLSL